MAPALWQLNEAGHRCGRFVRVADDLSSKSSRRITSRDSARCDRWRRAHLNFLKTCAEVRCIMLALQRTHSQLLCCNAYLFILCLVLNLAECCHRMRPSLRKNFAGAGSTAMEEPHSHIISFVASSNRPSSTLARGEVKPARQVGAPSCMILLARKLSLDEV